ncbi:MAG: monofunctional biosynthetic peptidoglycan transglycosylase [Pseudomonadota bacterium]|nr:monofunctional biosynthetic peptidoglycan transglycosylase [Pseudomonadota bacterium]
MTATRHAVRLLLLVLLCAAALQIVFAARIALMNLLDPESTAFQRSEAWRLLRSPRPEGWSQQWVDADQLSANLKRAVITSEDATFASHGGIDWAAIQKAWDRNQRAEVRAEKRAARLNVDVPVKIVGGSTISQQLAKNLFLSGERTVLRKAQEAALTLMLEALLGKERILTIYLNNVEWGEGVFGAQAAALHYFRVDAAKLSATQAARLAVMLPAPKRFEKRPASPYVTGRAATIVARMPAVQLP